MAVPKHYTPPLRRAVVSRLYHRAKAERVPMTVLANRLMESALDEPTTPPPATTTTDPPVQPTPG